MCLIAFSWLSHPRWKLALAGNRDEHYARPSAGADWWPEAPQVLGGRDLLAGGSWLAIDRRGRLAVVTNYREPSERSGRRSRGELVADFVNGERPIEDWSAEVAAQGQQWAGFNLLLFDLAEPARAIYVSNRVPGGPRPIEAGVHGLSNDVLDTDWPKVRALRTRLTEALQAPSPQRPLLAALADRQPAPDDELPDTGIGIERERLLSSARIRGNGYGTRASTLVLVDRDNRVEFIEQSWLPDGDAPAQERRVGFTLGATPRPDR